MSTGLTLAFALAVCAGAPPSAAPEEASAVKVALLEFLEGKRPAEELEITYSDLHGLYGGLKLTIRGTGDVEQKAVRRTAPEMHRLTAEQVRQLVELLVEKEAWKQETPEAVAVPDESRATLSITVGTAKSSIWERFNDLKSNKRMIEIRDRMQKFAWRETADKKP